MPFPLIPLLVAAMGAASKVKSANIMKPEDGTAVTPMPAMEKDMGAEDIAKLLAVLAQRQGMNKTDPANALGMAGQGAISGRNVLLPANSKKRRNMMAAGSAMGNMGQNALGALAVMSKMGMFDGGGGGGGGAADASGIATEGLTSGVGPGGMPWDELFGGWGGF